MTRPPFYCAFCQREIEPPGPICQQCHDDPKLVPYEVINATARKNWPYYEWLADSQSIAGRAMLARGGAYAAKDGSIIDYEGAKNLAYLEAVDLWHGGKDLSGPESDSLVTAMEGDRK